MTGLPQMAQGMSTGTSIAGTANERQAGRLHFRPVIQARAALASARRSGVHRGLFGLARNARPRKGPVSIYLHQRWESVLPCYEWTA